MKRIMNGMSAYFGRVPDWLRKRRIAAWLFFVVATAFFAFGASRAKFDTAIEGWFEKDDPLIVSFDWFHNDFGSDDHLYIVYRPKDGDVFSERSLATLRDFHRELEGRVRALKAGDASALQALAGTRPFVLGPHINIYNRAALVEHAALGAVRWVAPLDLSLDAIAFVNPPADPVRNPAGSALATEVFAWGRLPLAFSARCFIDFNPSPRSSARSICEKA